jgi:hypothetical protein
MSSTGTARQTVAELEDRWPSATKMAAAVGVGALLIAMWWVKSGSQDSVRTGRRPTPSAVKSAASGKTVNSSAAPVDSSATEPGIEDTSDATYEAVRRHTLQLLNEHKLKEAEMSARKLIELRPDDALGYRCLGSSLQDQGRVLEAKAVYSECVSRATKGDVVECSQLGGVKKP